ncbi:MAG TPA: DUF177 domain-containing protein [Beijerinckiaceae bacterium]|jgi:uncharacterized metal-binding protein YceD (DUF177 family)
MARHDRPTTEKPFSRPFLVEELLRRPDDTLTIEADAEERAALAAADEVPGVGALTATYRIAREGKFIHVTGEVRARVTQTCVVTLEPFESEVVEPVDVRFAEDAAPPPPPRPAGKRGRDGEPASRRRREPAKAPPPPPPALEEDEDPPDPIVDGRIDLGALAAEFLALGLDPYPRKPGAAFQPIAEEPEESPFAALAKLQTKG